MSHGDATGRRARRASGQNGYSRERTQRNRSTPAPGLSPGRRSHPAAPKGAPARYAGSLAYGDCISGCRQAASRGVFDRAAALTAGCDDLRVEQRISLVTLGVTDLGRARSFYEALGWDGAQQPDGEVCFFQSGGMVLGLWTALGGHGAAGIELAHNVRSPEEVGRILAEAERAGGTVLRPAAHAEWGGTSGAFADPDGYVWEIAHNPDWTLGADGSVRI